MGLASLAQLLVESGVAVAYFDALKIQIMHVWKCGKQQIVWISIAQVFIPLSSCFLFSVSCDFLIITDCFCKRLANPEVSCDDVGNYEALQCRRPDERLTCRCVSRSGTDIEGTETTVNSTSQAPDCGSKLVHNIAILTGNLK